MSLFPDLEKKKISAETLAEKALKDDRILSEVIEGVSSEKARVKFGCAKALRIIGEKNPKDLYPKWNFFVGLMDSGNTFLKCDGVFIIGQLARVDSENKLEKVFDKLYGLLDDKSMITAANLVGVSGVIAKVKPELEAKITQKLLGIDQTHHGSECKNVLKGHIITTLNTYFTISRDKKKILDFIRKETKNTRPSTRKKAEDFLRKWG